MASAGYVDRLLTAVETGLQRVLKEVFRYILTSLRFGPFEHQTRCENFQAYYLEGTTPATANQEFSIVHGLSRAPYLVVPVMPLNAVGARIVPLEVSRAADATRIYLKSSVASAPITVIIE